MWIAPDLLDQITENASRRDRERSARWRKATWWKKIWIWLDGDSPNGANHRADWRI